MMNKIKKILYFVIAAAFMLASCDDPYANQYVADPGSNEQEEIQSTDFQATVTTNPLTIALEDIENTFEFITLTSVPELVDSAAVVEYSVKLSDSDDFSTYKIIDLTTEGTALKTSYQVLNDTLKTLNSASESHSAYAKVLASIYNQGSNVLYTTESLSVDVTTCNYSPIPVVDSVSMVKNKELTYDVLANDTDPEGDELTLVSAEGASNGTVSVSENSVIYTPNTDYTGTDEFTYIVSDGNTTATGTVIVTILEKAAITQFWVVGDYNGWDNSDNAETILSTVDNTQAEGYIYLTSGGIKLVTDHSWGDDYTFGDDGLGNLTNPGDNITVSEDGYYFITADLSTMTYTLTKTVWGIIGSFNSWADQVNMTYYSTSKTFGMAYTFSENDEYKFRGTSDWAINYGDTGVDGILDAGGDNIVIYTAGDYAITLNLSTPNEYTYSANRWGLIGDATPGAWDADTDMTWDAENNVFTVTLELTAASIKFRANDAWDINYGGDINALTAGGDNITISEAGNYTVTFDPWGLTGTITKN